MEATASGVVRRQLIDSSGCFSNVSRSRLSVYTSENTASLGAASSRPGIEAAAAAAAVSVHLINAAPVERASERRSAVMTSEAVAASTCLRAAPGLASSTNCNSDIDLEMRIRLSLSLSLSLFTPNDFAD